MIRRIISIVLSICLLGSSPGNAFYLALAEAANRSSVPYVLDLSAAVPGDVPANAQFHSHPGLESAPTLPGSHAPVTPSGGGIKGVGGKREMRETLEKLVETNQFNKIRRRMLRLLIVAWIIGLFTGLQL